MTRIDEREARRPETEGVAGLEGSGLRHELVEAQVKLLTSHLEKRPPQQLTADIERLIACCRASFREEEALMARLGGQIDPAHRQRHHAVIDQLEGLRRTAVGQNPGRLLAAAILIDRELISHLAEAALAE